MKIKIVLSVIVLVSLYPPKALRLRRTKEEKSEKFFSCSQTA